MHHKRGLLTLVSLMLAIFMLIPSAAPVAADQPVAFAVFFYSTSCPHCHTVIERDLPRFEEEFGDQLEMLFVNVATEGGSYLYSATCSVLDTQNRCGGVPMMVVGDQIMIGAQEIPDQLPGIVRDGLAAGGIPLPDVPALQEAYQVVIDDESASQSETQADVEEPAGTVASDASELTVWERFNNDLAANIVAVIVLVGLIVSLLLVLFFSGRQQFASMQTWALRLSALAAVGIGLSLAAGSGGDTLATVLAWGVVILLGVTVVLIFRQQSAGQIILPVALAGLAVAAYLFQVESTASAATCGILGNCNSVQQSEYAKLFGVPVGLIGVIGYVAILFAWLYAYFIRPDGSSRTFVIVGLFSMTLIGTVFSAYLTFLEPFVIGATCAWCLSSAVTMLLLLWLVAPDGFTALRSVFRSTDTVVTSADDEDLASATRGVS